MPLGREIHTPRPYVPPSLDETLLTRMRAPPDGDDRTLLVNSDDSDDEVEEGKINPPGTFLGSSVASEGSYY